MDCKINWTDKAWDTYEENINYLLTNWTLKELNNFVQTVDRKITLLAKYPKLGSSKSTKQLNIRCTIIHKRIVLIYKHKPLKNEIDLLVFWNTKQHPRKLIV
jgi:plasmid stabilization system protein ParE